MSLPKTDTQMHIQHAVQRVNQTDTEPIEPQNCPICLLELLPCKLSQIFNQHFLYFLHKYEISVRTDEEQQQTVQHYVEQPDLRLQLKRWLQQSEHGQMLFSEDQLSYWLAVWMEIFDVGMSTISLSCQHQVHERCLFQMKKVSEIQKKSEIKLQFGTDQKDKSTALPASVWHVLPKLPLYDQPLTDCPLCRQCIAPAQHNHSSFSNVCTLPTYHAQDPFNPYKLKQDSLVWVMKDWDVQHLKFGTIGQVKALNSTHLTIQMLWPADPHLWQVAYEHVYDLLSIVTTGIPERDVVMQQKYNCVKPWMTGVDLDVSCHPWPSWQARQFLMIDCMTGNQWQQLIQHIQVYLNQPLCWSYCVYVYLTRLSAINNIPTNCQPDVLTDLDIDAHLVLQQCIKCNKN